MQRNKSDAAVLIPYLDSPFMTADGWELRLFRSPPPLGGDALGRPVLMLPGMSANRFSFGLRPGTSLAGALNAAGRDVWILEFRGAASSVWRGSGRGVVDLDRKLRFDIPAAARAVRQLTGAEAIDLVGHSLGGLFAYLYLGGPDAEPVGRAVTLAAPGSFTQFLGRGRALIHLPVRVLAPLARQLSGFGLPALARTAGPVPHLVAMRRHFHLGGVDVATQRAWLDHAVEDLPGGDLAQILAWAATGRLRGRDGDDYTDRLSRVRQPVLVIASAGDKLVAPGQRRQALPGHRARPRREPRLRPRLRAVVERRPARRLSAHRQLARRRRAGGRAGQPRAGRPAPAPRPLSQAAAGRGPESAAGGGGGDAVAPTPGCALRSLSSLRGE